VPAGSGSLPQAQIKPVRPEENPIVLKRGERALIGQLGLRAQYWLPIKTFDMRQIQQEGTDPIIGLLASMELVHKHELGK
jgi:hypothetical protein